MNSFTTLDLRPVQVPATGVDRKPSIVRQAAYAIALAATGIAILGLPMALRLGLFALGHPHMRFIGEAMRSFQ